MRLDVDGRAAYAYTGARALDAPASRTSCSCTAPRNDHSVWALQSRYFAHHGRNAFAVDLPGHGRSAGPAVGSVDAIAAWLVDVHGGRGHRARDARRPFARLARRARRRSARTGTRSSALALLGPAVPMPVSDALLAAARADDHAAFELINGWSFSAARSSAAIAMPGVWMTGNAMRLMERSAPGVLLHRSRRVQRLCGRTRGGERRRAARCCSCWARATSWRRRRRRASSRRPCPTCAVVTLPDCGHAMMAEAPDAVLDALRAFLDAGPA